MKTLALFLSMIMLTPAVGIAQPGWRYHPRPRYAHDRWESAPVFRSYPVYLRAYQRPPQVSVGSAVAGAVAAGAIAAIIGYQLGKNSNQQSQNCKTVAIDNEKKIVCRDSNGNWQVQ